MALPAVYLPEQLFTGTHIESEILFTEEQTEKE